MQSMRAVVVFVLALSSVLYSPSSSCEQRKTRLELQDYDQMSLVGIEKKSGEWFACFRLADGSQELAKVGSQLGLYRGSIISFTSEYLVVSQPVLVNGHEWVDSEFSWPISESSDRSKWQCR